MRSAVHHHLLGLVAPAARQRGGGRPTRRGLLSARDQSPFFRLSRCRPVEFRARKWHNKAAARRVVRLVLVLLRRAHHDRGRHRPARFHAAQAEAALEARQLMDCDARVRARRAPWRRLVCCFAVLGGVVNLAEGLPRACALAPARGGGARAGRPRTCGARRDRGRGLGDRARRREPIARAPTRGGGRRRGRGRLDHGRRPLPRRGLVPPRRALHLSRRPFGHALIAPVAALAIGRCRRPASCARRRGSTSCGALRAASGCGAR